MKCLACNGSGRYDHNGSPPCGACQGTGKSFELICNTCHQPGHNHSHTNWITFDREVFDEHGNSLGVHSENCQFPTTICTCGEVNP